MRILLHDSGGGEKVMAYEAAKARLCDAFWYEAPEDKRPQQAGK